MLEHNMHGFYIIIWVFKQALARRGEQVYIDPTMKLIPHIVPRQRDSHLSPFQLEANYVYCQFRQTHKIMVSAAIKTSAS